MAVICPSETMLLLRESQIDRYIRPWRTCIWLGIGLMVVAILLAKGFGLVTGLMLYSLGIYSLCFRNWRTEPGVWMLAGFLAMTLGPCWAYFEVLYLSWLWKLKPIEPRIIPNLLNKLRLYTDTALPLFIFAQTLRLSISVTVENFKRTRPHRQIDISDKP